MSTVFHGDRAGDIARLLLGDAFIARMPVEFISIVPAADPQMNLGFRVGDSLVFHFAGPPPRGTMESDRGAVFTVTDITKTALTVRAAKPPRRRKAWQSPWPKGSR